MIDLENLTIKEAHQKLVSKEISVRDLLDAYLKVIDEKNPKINAFLEVYSDVDSQVEEAQRMIDNGEAKILTGIPLAVKDNILIKGKKVSAASKILENYTATYDASVIEKLKKHNPVFIGRTNMDEFAMGGSTENSAFGPTKNPYDLSFVPGGSSGGSAAAVAMKGSLVALGSDTGGSIRQPASFCGVVGLKPTYGRVSRYGLMAMGSSLDQIGPIAKTVEDAEILFKEIYGQDKNDSTTFSDEIYKVSQKSSKDLVIGVSKGLLEKEGVEKSVLNNFNESVSKLEKSGFKIKEIDLEELSSALAVYYIIMPAEVSSNMARYDGIKFGKTLEGGDLLGNYLETRGDLLGDEVRRRIMLGTYVLSTGYYDAYYGKANSVRNLLKKKIQKIFEEVDVIALPTSPTPAFKIGDKISDPLTMYLVDIFTVPANIIGVPAISIPSGFDGKLPLGIQFMGPHGGEERLFSIGKEFELLI